MTSIKTLCIGAALLASMVWCSFPNAPAPGVSALGAGANDLLYVVKDGKLLRCTQAGDGTKLSCKAAEIDVQ